MADDNKALLAENKARKDAAAAAAKKNSDDLLKEREARIKFNHEKMAREAMYRPTPTPEEMLKALAGHGIDDKEPDGSPEQNMYHPVQNYAQQIEVGNKTVETKPVVATDRGYATRDIAAKPAGADAKPAVKPNL